MIEGAWVEGDKEMFACLAAGDDDDGVERLLLDTEEQQDDAVLVAEAERDRFGIRRTGSGFPARSVSFTV